MPDDTGQAPTTTQPQAGTTETTTAAATSQAAAPSTAQDAAPKTYDEAYVKQLRDEAAANRVKARDLEAKLAEIDNAKLSEQEKVAKRLAELEKAAAEKDAALRQERARVAITEAAVEQHVKPGLAIRLLSGAIEFDADGQPVKVAQALADLVKANPELAAAATAASAANPARGSQDTIQSNEAAIREMVYGSGSNIFDLARARANGGGPIV